jgi:hypothetical protein
MKLFSFSAKPFIPQDDIFHFLKDLLIFLLENCIFFLQEMMIDLEHLVQFFCFIWFLFFLVVGGLHQNVEDTFKHGESVVPYQWQNLPFFLTLFSQGVNYFSKGVVENGLFVL